MVISNNQTEGRRVDRATKGGFAVHPTGMFPGASDAFAPANLIYITRAQLLSAAFRPQNKFQP
jgi:hypothetical protein